MNTPQVSRTTKIILVAEFILLAYMLYVLSVSLYKSYQIDRVIKETEQKNTRLEKENQTLIEDYEYYSSEAYKEKIAKQNFNLVRPGEEVIVLAPQEKQFLTEEERTTQSTKQYYDKLSNPEKWFLFFFERDRFSE